MTGFLGTNYLTLLTADRVGPVVWPSAWLVASVGCPYRTDYVAAAAAGERPDCSPDGWDFLAEIAAERSDVGTLTGAAAGRSKDRHGSEVVPPSRSCSGLHRRLACRRDVHAEWRLCRVAGPIVTSSCCWAFAALRLRCPPPSVRPATGQVFHPRT
uniref:(northern house mosquito) hypothetical protein n=1 Tax=Culex pipiens TaxID=7175 RepID=A0A8D8E9B1_CULPI